MRIRFLLNVLFSFRLVNFELVIIFNLHGFVLTLISSFRLQCLNGFVSVRIGVNSLRFYVWRAAFSYSFVLVVDEGHLISGYFQDGALHTRLVLGLGLLYGLVLFQLGLYPL